MDYTGGTVHNIKYYLGKDYLMRSKGAVRQSSGYGKERRSAGNINARNTDQRRVLDS